MKYAGFDPDLRRSAYASVTATGGLVYLAVAPMPPKGLSALDMASLACRWVSQIEDLPKCMLLAEAMQDYPGSRVNANDLLPLNAISGAAVATAREGSLILPAAWKGTTPKAAHHARLCRDMGWKHQVYSDHCRPLDAPDWANKAVGKPGNWKHVMDAIGIARFLWERETKAARRARARAALEEGTR